MAMHGDEQSLIERFFRPLGGARGDVPLGIGDDAAVLHPAPGFELVVTTDALIEGAHFLAGADPRSLGHRALAVNLSDIAAMGATPCWATLALALPVSDESWLQPFCTGFAALLSRHCVSLVGGNLARGALNITVQLIGQARAGQAVRRSGALPGHMLALTGTVGDAAAGLALHRGQLQSGHPSVATELCQRFEYPQARVAFGAQLGALAHAAIDISDGLWRDAGRLLAQSGCGAVIDAERLPLSRALRTAAGDAAALRYALHGGEDYELLIAFPASNWEPLQALAAATDTPLAHIGDCTEARSLRLICAGVETTVAEAGFDHFR
jgi:thiamine-monophosphate kinase